MPGCVLVQSSKLQSLYSQTEAAFKESDARVKQLSSELATAQMEAKGLKNELRNVQVSRSKGGPKKAGWTPGGGRGLGRGERTVGSRNGGSYIGLGWSVSQSCQSANQSVDWMGGWSVSQVSQSVSPVSESVSPVSE